MTSTTHDTHIGPRRDTSVWFGLAARALPICIGAQFLLAGQSLFNGLPWEAHMAVGFLIALPVAALLTGTLMNRHLRGLRWWAGVTTCLYLIQVGLGAMGPFGLGLHPFNAALFLSASLLMLMKVERRRRPLLF